MPDPVNPATRSLVSLALDAASLRQLTHATNIAMAGTVGYRTRTVEFEEHLGAVRDAIAQGALGRGHLEHVEARQVSAAGSVGQAIQLDQEVGAMARNALHYQLLVKLIGRHYASMSLAMDGGRR